MKTMKNMVLAAIAFSASLAFADISNYFYWGIDASMPDFDYAVLTWTLENGTSGYASDAAGDSGDIYFGMEKGAEGGMLAQIGSGNLAGSSYSVELFDANDNSIYQSEAFAYAAIAGSGNFFYTDMDPNLIGTTPYLFSTGAVPEPTSGLLMLVGLGAMALKRRRAKKA